MYSTSILTNTCIILVWIICSGPLTNILCFSRFQCQESYQVFINQTDLCQATDLPHDCCRAVAEKETIPRSADMQAFERSLLNEPLAQQINWRRQQLNSLLEAGMANLVNKGKCLSGLEKTLCDTNRCLPSRVHDQHLYCKIHEDIIPVYANLQYHVGMFTGQPSSSFIEDNYPLIDLTSLKEAEAEDVWIYTLTSLQFHMEELNRIMSQI